MIMSAWWRFISSNVASSRIGARSGYVSSQIWPNCMLNWTTRKRLIGSTSRSPANVGVTSRRSHRRAIRGHLGFGVVFAENETVDLRFRRAIQRRVCRHGRGARRCHLILVPTYHWRLPRVLRRIAGHAMIEWADLRRRRFRVFHLVHANVFLPRLADLNGRALFLRNRDRLRNDGLFDATPLNRLVEFRLFCLRRRGAAGRKAIVALRVIDRPRGIDSAQTREEK